MISIVCGTELDVHQVDSGSGGGDKEDLHRSVVEGDEVSNEVEVTGDEDHHKQDLGLAGDTGAAPRLPYLEEEDEYCEKMGDIPN